MFTSPSKPATPGGSSGSVEVLETSESPTRPKAEVVQPVARKLNPGALAQHTNQRERLKANWNTLSSTIMDWLLKEDENGKRHRLETMLEETKLKDIGVMLGISTEKVLLLDGQPTQIIGNAEQKKLDELLPALLAEAKRRGAKVEMTERKAELTLNQA